MVGAHGAGGEIGHLCVNYEETDHCGCGNTGCLEQYASATGITRLANIRLAKDDKASVLRGQEVSAKTVFDAVKADDEVAKEIAEEFGKQEKYFFSMLKRILRKKHSLRTKIRNLFLLH